MDASWLQNALGFLKSDSGKNIMSAAGNMSGGGSGGNDTNSTSQIVHTAYRGTYAPEGKPEAATNESGEDNFLTKLMAGLKMFQNKEQEVQK